MGLVNRTKVTISLENGIAEWLEDQADKEDRNKGRIVERLLKEYRDKLENDNKAN